MANGRSQVIAALDVGSSKVSCAVAQPLDDGYRVLGAASRRAEGLRRGVITEMDAAEGAIRDVVDQAEQKAGVAVEDVFVSLSGGMPSSHVTEVEMAAPDRPITDQDVRRLLRLAGTREEQGERSVLHAIPVGFTLDGETGIQDPRGMVGRRLSARVHLLSAAQGAQRNLKVCIERCLLRPVDLVAAPYAAGLGCLSWDARDLGSVVIDLGAGVTKIGIFRNGSLIFADAIPIGSAHITNDIASIPGLTLAFAERLKTRHGSLFVGPNDDDVTVTLPTFVEGWTDGTGQMSLSLLTGIIRPRVEEIFETVREIIDSSGHAAIAGRNIVLTGGGSLLTGIDALARDILDRPVSLGRPIGLDGLKKDMSGPDFTTLAGTIAFAERRLEARHAVDVPAALPGRVRRMIRLGRWLRENF